VKINLITTKTKVKVAIVFQKMITVRTKKIKTKIIII